MSMEFAQFKERAMAEGRRYGGDRMVFVRELAQNARDAGAFRVQVNAAVVGDEFVFSFSDDGHGMGFEHARNYLFTLYASSKEDEIAAAGRFGVGFWSVLLIAPDTITIESMAEDTPGWRVSFDGGLGEQRLEPGRLMDPGTVITLKRPVTPQDGKQLVRQVGEGLVKYCKYLRRNDKESSPLAVLFNGERIDRPLFVDGPCWTRFREGSVEGAVGLGDKPRVELYASGLLVWNGTTLEELRYGARARKEESIPLGLAPIYVLNGNDLSTTLDRRAVIDNRALSAVRAVARRQMRNLVGRYLDGISPRPFGERVRDAFLGFVEEIRISGALKSVGVVAGVLALLVITGLVTRALSQQTGGLPGGEFSFTSGGPLDPEDAQAGGSFPISGEYSGPRINPVGDSRRASVWYSPPAELYLRTVVATQLHPGRGIVARQSPMRRDNDPFSCDNDCVTVRALVSDDATRIPLPIPTGHRVVTGSTHFNGKPVTDLLVDEYGNQSLQLAEPARGELTYTTGLLSRGLQAEEWNALLQIPQSMPLTKPLQEIVDEARAFASPEERVALIVRYVEATIDYDRSSATAEAYKRFVDLDPSYGWVEFVTTLSAGDCDVKNTLVVLLARRAGVPARLALGLAGSNGRVDEGMHAWVEYHDGEWKIADATGTAPSPPVSSPLDTPGAGVGGAGQNPGVFSQETPTGGGDSSPPVGSEWIVIAGVVAGVSMLLAILLLLLGRRPEPLGYPGEDEARNGIAARMLMGVLSNPRLWLKGSGLSSRRLLPVLGGGKKMSLSEALKLASRGRLMRSAGRASLARKAVARGARILDGEDAAFGDLAGRLPGIVDLDDVARLDPVRSDRLEGWLREQARLVEWLDDVVSLVGFPRHTLVPCRGLTDAPVSDIDLSALARGGYTRWPARFVAVSVFDAHQGPPPRTGDTFELRAYFLLERILHHSELLARDADAIRLAAAGRVLGVAS